MPATKLASNCGINVISPENIQDKVASKIGLHLNIFSVILNTAVFNQLLKKLSTAGIDVVILS